MNEPVSRSALADPVPGHVVATVGDVEDARELHIDRLALELVTVALQVRTEAGGAGADRGVQALAKLPFSSRSVRL